MSDRESQMDTGLRQEWGNVRGASAHQVALAREALSWGLDGERVVERLRLHIKRDEQYLAYRERKGGQRTLTGDAIAGDLLS
jgi:hypothetical protein